MIYNLHKSISIQSVYNYTILKMINQKSVSAIQLYGSYSILNFLFFFKQMTKTEMKIYCCCLYLHHCLIWIVHAYVVVYVWVVAFVSYATKKVYTKTSSCSWWFQRKPYLSSHDRYKESQSNIKITMFFLDDLEGTTNSFIDKQIYN
jgi:hypothetical protein